MILVNYLGQFPSMPETFRHHDDYMSYADTIAPLFLFVAGVGFRLSYLRNRERLGLGGAHGDAGGQFLDIGAAEHVLLAQQAQQALQDHQAFVAVVGPVQVHHRSPCWF